MHPVEFDNHHLAAGSIGVTIYIDVRVRQPRFDSGLKASDSDIDTEDDHDSQSSWRDSPVLRIVGLFHLRPGWHPVPQASNGIH